MPENFESRNWEGEEFPEDKFKRLLEEEELLKKREIEEEKNSVELMQEAVEDLLRPKDHGRQAIIVLLRIKEHVKELVTQLAMLENAEERKKKQGFAKRLVGRRGEAKKKASIKRHMEDTLHQLDPALKDLGMEAPKTTEEAKQMYDTVCSFKNWQKLSKIIQEIRPTSFDDDVFPPDEEETGEE